MKNPLHQLEDFEEAQLFLEFEGLDLEARQLRVQEEMLRALFRIERALQPKTPTGITFKEN